mmetsp:Transcript_23299/g.32191  ORF Transcript_23299/g.32191 Transcript_23299/m.32191 type:complete len:263 (+) Transcript_23299:293-1081(+)|eukprot:CAMPEP_0196598096 /NCGR_PEP_ID=MMETSP1081-20130531/94122_1 /TAXON_ID=36882 /ORGANISM="Pyramimonas amylifera, Strain CCMP720" /LENGTH=262 /DNA_ID=CAMNT_0041923737 /DNA_START=288 /DNA_END=1076 /DNA_ORIENTATION=-
MSKYKVLPEGQTSFNDKRASISERFGFSRKEDNKKPSAVVLDHLGPKSKETLRRLSVKALFTERLSLDDPAYCDGALDRHALEPMADAGVPRASSSDTQRDVDLTYKALESNFQNIMKSSQETRSHEKTPSRNEAGKPETEPRLDTDLADRSAHGQSRRILQDSPATHIAEKKSGNMWGSKLGHLFSANNTIRATFAEAYKDIASSSAPSVAKAKYHNVSRHASHGAPVGSLGPKSQETLRRISMLMTSHVPDAEKEKNQSP